jgi:hypothetical protein
MRLWARNFVADIDAADAFGWTARPLMALQQRGAALEGALASQAAGATGSPAALHLDWEFSAGSVVERLRRSEAQ